MASTSPTNLRGQRGITLVEVAVSAMLLSLTFLGVITMLQKSRDIDFESDIYLQAKRLARSALEENEYHPSNYATLAPGTAVYADLEIYPSINSTRSITVVKRVVIDPQALDATGWVGRSIPYRRITATISWEAGAKSVSATKRIARSHP